MNEISSTSLSSRLTEVERILASFRGINPIIFDRVAKKISINTAYRFPPTLHNLDDTVYHGIGSLENTKFTFLNVDRLDSGPLTTDGTNVSTTGSFISTVATGTAPLSVTSTTVVNNLNADLLDGQHGSYYAPMSIHTNTLEPTGFLNKSSSSLDFNDSIRTFSITAPYTYYYRGVLHTIAGNKSVQIPNATGLYWIYLDENEVLTVATVNTFPGFDQALVGSVYWNASISQGLAADERHGCVMDYMTHHYAHDNFGTRYEPNSGLTGTFATSTMTITAGTIWDEDLELSIAQQTVCAVLYKNGSANWEWSASPSLYPALISGGNLQYNNGNTLTAAGPADYVAYWVFATNGLSGYAPIWVVIGQRVDTTLANARANNTYASLSLGSLPSAEMKILYRVIYSNSGTPAYVEAQDLRNVSNLPSGTYTATSHAILSNLDYASAGHTGFASIVGLTSGYHPYFNGTNLADGPIRTDGIKIGIGQAVGTEVFETTGNGVFTGSLTSLVGYTNFSGSAGLAHRWGRASDPTAYNLSLQGYNPAALTGSYKFTLTSPLSGSVDVMSFRANRVGILNLDPQQALDVTGNIQASGTLKGTTGILTNLTTGYLPYHVNDTSGFADSPFFSNGLAVAFNSTSVSQQEFYVRGLSSVKPYIFRIGSDDATYDAIGTFDTNTNLMGLFSKPNFRLDDSGAPIIEYAYGNRFGMKAYSAYSGFGLPYGVSAYFEYPIIDANITPAHVYSAYFEAPNGDSGNASAYFAGRVYIGQESGAEMFELTGNANITGNIKAAGNLTLSKDNNTGDVEAIICNTDTAGTATLEIPQDSACLGTGFFIRRYGSTHATTALRDAVSFYNSFNAPMHFYNNGYRHLSLSGTGVLSLYHDDDESKVVSLTTTAAGALSVSYMNSAGFVKNDASGILSGGNAVAWSDITSGKPTTLSGYGITDAVSNTTAKIYNSGDNTKYSQRTVDSSGVETTITIGDKRNYTVNSSGNLLSKGAFVEMIIQLADDGTADVATLFGGIDGVLEIFAIYYGTDAAYGLVLTRATNSVQVIAGGVHSADDDGYLCVYGTSSKTIKNRLGDSRYILLRWMGNASTSL